MRRNNRITSLLPINEVSCVFYFPFQKAFKNFIFYSVLYFVGVLTSHLPHEWHNLGEKKIELKTIKLLD